MSQFFAHVNDFVLRRPLVSIVTDDARSALQVDTARYDLIVSEPSNPWLAGVATLYTPEFFRIARARLTDDGVFCQWVQTYQVSVPVVATLVGNMQQVFSYVEVWAGVPGDLIVLGSARPFAYSGPALERLFVPHSATGEMIREYLGTDTPTAYLGRRLLAASDVRRLTARATLVHDDDRPVLEFVAARQFMDLRSRDVFDSVVALAGVGRGDSSAVIARARALSVRRWDLTRLKYVEAAYRVAPRDDYWSVQLGGLLLAENHPEFADSALRRLLRTNASPPPDAWLLSGVLNLRAGRLAAARAQFTRALAAGADTAETSANLAVVAVREGRWSEAIANARRGLEAARGTARHPYPMYALREAWDSLALRGPADEVERLLTAAVARRPNIATIHEHQALAALRAGNCDSGIQGLLQMMDFGYERADAADLVARCRRGERF
ncbi:MAG TPA: fused MFS/spermidine synthase, partial [Gemmatimonadales bacterium]|nr:fused MFS/spermidine synthase [Gemmatimonadales bacterium]